MDRELLRQHIQRFVADAKHDPERFNQDLRERKDLVSYYREFPRERMASMTSEDFYAYLSKLWAMQIWGNKHYVVDNIVADNGLEDLRGSLADLVWGETDIAQRWDAFRASVKGMGPAMISEILCKTHPRHFMLWNRRAYVGLNYLKADGLPRYDYQLTGEVYKHLCDVSKDIATELRSAGIDDDTLLAVDYFIWAQLQVEDTLSAIYKKKPAESDEAEPIPTDESKFIHNDVRDKLRDIGQWLGFTADIEQKVS